MFALLLTIALSLEGNLYAGGAAYNDGSYAARPDNSGVALFRAGMNLRLNLPVGFGVGGNMNMFTDRKANPCRPSELDLMPTLYWRYNNLEIQVIYERLMPVDSKGAGLTQQFVQVLGVWYFRKE